MSYKLLSAGLARFARRLILRGRAGVKQFITADFHPLFEHLKSVGAAK